MDVHVQDKITDKNEIPSPAKDGPYRRSMVDVLLDLSCESRGLGRGRVIREQQSTSIPGRSNQNNKLRFQQSLLFP